MCVSSPLLPQLQSTSESIICFSLLAMKIALTGGEDREHDGSYSESTSEHGLDKECRS